MQRRVFLSLLALVAFAAEAIGATAPPAFDAELLAIQHDWARASYELEDAKARIHAFEALQARAAAFARAYPGRAEPLIWQGIVESGHAGAKGGLGALSLAKAARKSLESSLKIDPTALNGSAYTSLGALYYKVPGFPIGFGDHDKARDYLEQALKQNPDGIDANFFLGELSYEDGKYGESLRYLDKAARAAPRPGRESADRGRQAEIAALRAKVTARAG